MKVNKLEAVNFKNYSKLSIDFNKLENINFILGKNGLGKSSILDALSYSLFGKTLQEQSGDSVINNKTKKNMKVSLHFNIDKDTYQISRYRKDKVNKNKVLLFKNGDEISKPHTKDTDLLIIKILGFDINIFKQVVSFNATSSELFVNGTDKYRKDFLEKLLNISIFDKSLEIAKQEYKDTNSIYLNKKEELKSLKEKEELSKSLISNYEKSLSLWKSSYINCENQYKELKDEFDSIKENDTSLIPKYKNKINNLNAEISSYNSDSLSLLLGEYNKVKYKLSSLKKDYMEYKKDYISCKEDYNNLINSPNPVCKYCGSTLNDEHKKKELNRLMQDGKKAGENATKLKKEATLLLKKESELKNNIDIEKEKQNKYAEKVSSINDEITDIRLKIKEIEDSVSRKNKLGISMKNIDDKLVYLENEKPKKPKIDDFEKDINSLTNSIKSLEDELVVLDEVKNLFNQKGLKNAYISSSLPLINKNINQYLSILSDDTIGCSILTKTEDKKGNSKNKINLKIDYPNRGDNITFNDLSSGEKRIVSLSILLAFNLYFQKNNSFKILLLDEVFDTLSEDRIDNVIKLLKEIKNEYDYIFVISHLDSLKYNNEFNKINIIQDNNNNSICSI